MDIAYYKEYSRQLGRDMEFKRYGWGGKICVVFPCLNGRFYDYEDFHMPEAIAPFINSGKLQLFCVDSIDAETWTAQGDPRRRMERHEAWYRYITEELTPRMYQITGSREKLMSTGCSMGAFHAANFFFRRPDLFDTVLALSGVYGTEEFLGDYCDELVYLNSPLKSLPHLGDDHPYLELYCQSRMVFCVGQGAWEDALLESTRQLDEVLRCKGIPAWVDYWGTDVVHDWPWWYRQMDYFLGHLFP